MRLTCRILLALRRFRQLPLHELGVDKLLLLVDNNGCFSAAVGRSEVLRRFNSRVEKRGMRVQRSSVTLLGVHQASFRLDKGIFR